MDDRKKQVLDELSNYHGIVTDACRRAEVPRSTFYKWLKEDKEFKQAVEDVQEEAIDFVEGQLFKKISGVMVKGNGGDDEDNYYSQPPSDTAIIFYLKTKAKKRGYVERQEIEAKIEETKYPAWFSNLPVITTTNGQLKES